MGIKQTQKELPLSAQPRRYLIKWAWPLLLLPVAGLALASASQAYFAFDLLATRQLQQLTNPYFQKLMIAVSWPGYEGRAAIATLSFTVIILFFRLRLEAACLLLSAGVGGLLNDLLKNLVQRPRPNASLVQVYATLPTLSFPSGHVVHYMALYGFLFYLTFTLLPSTWLRRGALFLLAAMIALVGMSRIYLGAHWLSDVTGGYLFGLAWLLFVIDFYWRRKKLI